jgi:hypothetical protein
MRQSPDYLLLLFANAGETGTQYLGYVIATGFLSFLTPLHRFRPTSFLIRIPVLTQFGQLEFQEFQIRS